MNDIEEKIEEVETLHVYPMQGGIFITKEDTEPVIESVPTPARRSLTLITTVITVSCLAIIGTLAILPYSPTTEQLSVFHSFALTHDLQSYTLPPVTMHQSITIATTGKGHTDATRAHGSITFYNGSFTQQDIPMNMIFSANSVEVVTDEMVTVPAGNPPNYGVASVPAHALNAGTRGNIAAYSINTQCCATSVEAVNTDAFSGGRNARDYHTIAQKDIDSAVTSLSQSLYLRVQQALQMGLTPDEALIPLPCSSTVSSNHRVGQEATSVTIRVSETCSVIAYSQRDLQDKARELVHVPTGYVLTRVAIHRISTTLTSNQKSATIVISITLGYNSLVRKGIAK